jgi:glycerol kinase
LKKLILSIDQGTTSSRSILFDLKGKKIFSSQSEFKSLNEIKYKWKKNAIFKPKISQKIRNNLLHGWQQAIRKTLA